MICIGGVADGQEGPAYKGCPRIRMQAEECANPIRAVHMSATYRFRESWYAYGKIAHGHSNFVEFWYDVGMSEQDAILRVFANYKPNCECEG